MFNHCSLSVRGPFPSSIQSCPFMVLYVDSGCASCWFISIFRTCTSAPAAILQFKMLTCVLCPHITKYADMWVQCSSVHWPAVHTILSLCSNHLIFYPPPCSPWNILSLIITCPLVSPHSSPVSLLPSAPSSSASPWSRRPWEPAPPAGQRHAGCQWLVSTDGGDGEAGCAESPPGRKGALLYIY